MNVSHDLKLEGKKSGLKKRNIRDNGKGKGKIRIRKGSELIKMGYIQKNGKGKESLNKIEKKLYYRVKLEMVLFVEYDFVCQFPGYLFLICKVLTK